MKNKIIAILIVGALVLTTVICVICTYNPTPSLVQDTFPASTEQKFIYENSSNGPIVEVSDDSTYYELRTRFGDVRLTDYGTKTEIDSLRPIRAKDVVKIYNKLKFLNK
jgi:hypothetical protein